MDKIMENRTPTEAIYKEIGREIASLRKDLNITQQELATKVNTTRQTITLYETGVRRIPLVALMDISKALHVDFEQLIPDLRTKKPGPEPKIKLSFERIMELDDSDQKIVLDLLDSLYQKRQSK